MEKNPEIKVSVLVPVYNVERLLPRCLDSLLGQTLSDIEVVCVNDASPDNSAAVLADYAARDPRIRVITKTANEGLMMARQTGYLNARGQYLCFCDSDDYMPDNALELLYARAIQTDADITVGEMYLENNSGRHVLKQRTNVSGTHGKEYLKAILHWTTCSLCGSLFKRKLFENQNYTTFKNQSFSEDRLLLTQILAEQQPSIATLSVPTYFYCLNNASITRKKLSENALREQLSALFKCYDYVNLRMPELEADNRNFIIRYLSLYIEKGEPIELLLNAHKSAKELLEFNEIKKITSFRFAFHTTMCMQSNVYSSICRFSRSVIRKLQGKD